MATPEDRRTEDELLADLVPRLPRGRHTVVPSGDDAAVVDFPSGRVVVSTDVLVENRHFRLEWGSGADLGWRAAMQNLADIAAMGAEARSMVVALAVPGRVTTAWLRDLADGFAQACAPRGVGVDGGDLSGGDQLMIAVTVMGEVEQGEPVLRSGARPGDVVAHAGVLGEAAAGLALLDAGLETPPGSAEAGDVERRAHAGAVRRFLRPEPPLALGPAAGRAGATAMLDVSDGLLRDADRIGRASGVLLDLDPESAALRDSGSRLEVLAARLGVEAAGWVLGGGEDHGLLATFPADTTTPTGFEPIGVVREASHAPGVTLGGVRPALGGWDHFER